jgi:hypothetical protein
VKSASSKTHLQDSLEPRLPTLRLVPIEGDRTHVENVEQVDVVLRGDLRWISLRSHVIVQFSVAYDGSVFYPM